MTKSQKIKAIKSKKPWYRQGKSHCVIVEGVHGAREILLLSRADNEELDKILSGEIECYETIDEEYGISHQNGEQVVEGSRINPENEQRIIYNRVSLAYMAEYEDYQMQYEVATNQYYDWTSELARDIEAVKERDMETLGYANEYVPSREFTREKKKAFNKLPKEIKELL